MVDSVLIPFSFGKFEFEFSPDGVRMGTCETSKIQRFFRNHTQVVELSNCLNNKGNDERLRFLDRFGEATGVSWQKGAVDKPFGARAVYFLLL